MLHIVTRDRSNRLAAVWQLPRFKLPRHRDHWHESIWWLYKAPSRVCATDVCAISQSISDSSSYTYQIRSFAISAHIKEKNHDLRIYELKWKMSSFNCKLELLRAAYIILLYQTKKAFCCCCSFRGSGTLRSHVYANCYSSRLIWKMLIMNYPIFFWRFRDNEADEMLFCVIANGSIMRPWV